jgi:hypothetical protein
MKSIQLFVLSAFTVTLFACGPDYSYEEDYAMNAYEMEIFEEIRAEDPEAYAAMRAYQARNQQVIRNEKSTFKPVNYRMQGYEGGKGNGNNTFSGSTNGNDNIMWFELKNPQTGQTLKYVPLPSNWQVKPNVWESPNGSKLMVYPGKELGGHVQSIGQVIQQNILPLIQQLGGRVDKTIDLPGIARADQQEMNEYEYLGGAKPVMTAKGLELTELSTGDKSIMIVHFMRLSTNYGTVCKYWFHLMGTEGSAASHEKDKQAVIYALSNFKMNAQAVAVQNRQTSNMLAQKDAVFQKNQAQKWDHFNKMQDIKRSTSNSVSDTYQDMYRNINGMRDAGHKKSIDAIWEESPYTNPYNGQSMNRSNDYKYYYMNQAGQTFGTNDPNYNPAQDPQMNQYNWRQMSSGN